VEKSVLQYMSSVDSEPSGNLSIGELVVFEGLF